VFNPAFSPIREEAIKAGHINLSSKIHYDVGSSSYPGWFITCHPKSDSHLLTAFPDDKTGCADSSKTQSGTSMVAFGYSGEIPSLTDSECIIRAFQCNVATNGNNQIKAYLAHDWAKDDYSKGAWCCFAPGHMSKYTKELQKTHGSGTIVMASADWSDGWRGFIDGAVDQGKRAALSISSLLSEVKEC
jgi:hypothetical protein